MRRSPLTLDGLLGEPATDPVGPRRLTRRESVVASLTNSRAAQQHGETLALSVAQRWRVGQNALDVGAEAFGRQITASLVSVGVSPADGGARAGGGSAQSGTVCGHDGTSSIPGCPTFSRSAFHAGH